MRATRPTTRPPVIRALAALVAAAIVGASAIVVGLSASASGPPSNTPTFDPAIPLAGGVVDTQVGDLTGDGLPEIVTFNGDATVTVFTNGPAGTFTPTTTAPFVDCGFWGMSAGPAGIALVCDTGLAGGDATFFFLDATGQQLASAPLIVDEILDAPQTRVVPTQIAGNAGFAVGVAPGFPSVGTIVTYWMDGGDADVEHHPRRRPFQLPGTAARVDGGAGRCRRAVHRLGDLAVRHLPRRDPRDRSRRRQRRAAEPGPDPDPDPRIPVGRQRRLQRRRSGRSDHGRHHRGRRRWRHQPPAARRVIRLHLPCRRLGCVRAGTGEHAVLHRQLLRRRRAQRLPGRRQHLHHQRRRGWLPGASTTSTSSRSRSPT